jgi:hydroxyacylglutathione hydrolase
MRLFIQYSPHGFSNVYLLGPEKPGQAIIIDPGLLDVKLLDHLERNGYTVGAVLVTHNHPSHIRGLSTLRKIYDVEVFSASAEILDRGCTLVSDKQVLKFADIEIEVLSVPGHTADSLAYRIDNLVFTGDAMSAGLIGKTNSSYGSHQLLLNLWQKVLSLSDDTLIFPGHGPPSSVRSEKLYSLGLADPGKKQGSRFKDIERLMDG